MYSRTMFVAALVSAIAGHGVTQAAGPPAPYARSATERLRQLGLGVLPGERELNSVGATMSYGVAVKAVTPGSAAEKAGLKVGDFILMVEDRSLLSAEVMNSGWDAAVEALARPLSKSGTVRLTVARAPWGGRSLEPLSGKLSLTMKLP